MRGELPDAAPPTWTNIGLTEHANYPPHAWSLRPCFNGHGIGAGDHDSRGNFMYGWGSTGTGWGTGTNGTIEHNYADGKGSGWFPK